MKSTMRAAVFLGKGRIGLREVPKPEPGVGQALVRVTLTTICGTDVHILRLSLRGPSPRRNEQLLASLCPRLRGTT
jgi:threonine dehydrogenase-like Zn-dependent dehydrogenase